MVCIKVTLGVRYHYYFASISNACRVLINLLLKINIRDRAIPALVYEVDSDGIHRNGMLISSQVEDLQIEYAVDEDGDGTIDDDEFPIHDLNASVPSEVRGLRVSVTTRAAVDDLAIDGTGLPAAGNRSAGAADAYRRRMMITTVVSRNLL